jgi:predicted nucleic acid-binding protein
VIVVDASVVVKWFLPEVDSAVARALHGQEMQAPVIWITEVANAFWHHVRIGELSTDQATALVFRLSKAPIISAGVEGLLQQAFALANALPHPIYDCLYLALALQENTVLVTADGRFARTVRMHGQWSRSIRLLGES